MSQKNIKISLKGGIVAIMIVAVMGMAFATIILSKQLPATGTLVSGANFNIYSDSACTTLMETVDLGNIKRNDVVTKLAWLKFTIAPEDQMKYSFSVNNLNEVTVVVKTMPSDLVVAPNVQFGATHTTTATIEPVKIIFTVSNTATLGESCTATVTFNANNPPV
jgi:hypothetical protein